MSSSFQSYYYDPVFPWTSTRNDERFFRLVKWILAIFIIFGLIVPWLPSPEVEKKQLKQVSPRLAKLITQKRLQKPKIPKVKAVKKKAVKKKVKKKAKKKIAKKKQAKAKKKAKQTGLAAMSSEIQNLSDLFDTSSLASNKPLRSSNTKAKANKRSSVLTTKAKRSSGGIDTSKLSRSTGNTGLAGRQTSAVSSNIGGGSGTGSTRRTSSGQNVRGIEELNLVFEKYKGALQNIYQRALRKDPTLQGKVVFELTINAAGQVVKCRIVSSELGNKALERKLVSRVKGFRFAAKNVATVTVTMPIDLLPS